MKVLQIIDTLHAGGAERMAVTYANMLQERGISSFLCCTREEGLLKEEIKPGVGYIFLNKKSTFHLKPIFQLQKFIKKNKITIVHAHGTSFFTATLQKLLSPKLKLVWHEHNGFRISETIKKNKELVFCSRLFDAVIAVNLPLKDWGERNLKSHKIIFLANFVKNVEITEKKNNIKSGVDIVCLANLREPKNHLNLLNAFSNVVKDFPESKLHLVGKDLRDEYSANLQEFLDFKNLRANVVFHGVKSQVNQMLMKMDLGILSSDSEGLPMALLEYGQAGLPVVVTEVGQCKEVVQNFGKVVEPKNAVALAEAINFYFKNPDIRQKDAKCFQEHVKMNYTEDVIFPKLKKIYSGL